MRWWIGVLLVGVLVTTAGVVMRFATGRGDPAAVVPAPEVVSQPPSAGASRSPTPVVQLPGDIPTEGPGTFVFGTTNGPVLGTSGSLRRIRVAVESNVEGELAGLAEAVDRVLGDPRSWIAGKQVRFQRVGQGQPFDFTVYVVTRQTAYEMCKVNGNDIRENGVPYTSCRMARKVILNLDRWRLSVPEYVAGGVPLQTYREYLINHEVGHELGRGHELCPGPGRPAPVMQQQTLALKGCTANGWPYLDGKRYAGPPVS